MRICLDLRCVGDRMHGIARYGLELTRALSELGAGHRIVVLGRRPRSQSGGRRVAWVRCRARPYGPLEQATVPFRLLGVRPDVYHSVTYGYPVLAPCPTVVTLHDALPWARPWEFSPAVRAYWSLFVRAGIRRAAGVVVDSTYTLSGLVSRVRVPVERLHVVHLGGDHLVRVPVQGSDRRAWRGLGLEGAPFFLSVSNGRAHKNIRFALGCFLSSRRLARRRARYVLVGTQSRDEDAWIHRHDAAGQVVRLSDVSDGLLRLLYTEAAALVCPSYGEGFFLPAAEARALGCPVLAAREGALPEVLGADGVLLDATDPRAWQEAMVRVLDGGRRQGEGVMGTDRHSWNACARAMMEVYERAAGASGAP